MSGHNPHSRVSQPVNSSSWNHLQVPSYMPRQPQLAHMSSERTLRSSPLIWPNTTNPADAFYNYMALTAAAAVANSNPKNTALDMNPLLPFVRTPTNAMPFNSVDLSLSSGTTNPTNRNSLTPSPRNLVSPGTSSNRFSKSIAGDVDDSINNGANKAIDDTNKLGTDPIAFLSEMSEQLASMRSNRNMTTSSTLPPLPREQNNINSDLSNFRINGGNDKSKQRSEPMELGRESNATNLFENESLSNSVHLQQLLGLTPPATSSITPNLNDLSKSLLSIFNSNTSTATTVNTSPMLISPKSHSNFLPRQTDTSKNYLNTSNDDSLDSQSGAICNGDDGTGKQQNTRYRRRKPQKTVRCSSNELNTSDNTMDNEKNNAIKNDCHKVDNNLSNGINFSSFHSETNSILPSVNSVATTLPPPSMSTSTSVTTAPPTLPQTQSMDLSHHCTNQEMFENGLGNYSKSNDLNLTNSTVASQRNDKDTSNLLQSDEMNGLNIFGSVNFGHMRGVNLTNDIATFPNTDDLVKKVEELVKCNEQNGFGDNDFSPMELTKSDNNKMVSDAYENNRLSNGICESIKTSTNIEHVNNHSNVVKCIGNGNDNGIVAGMMCDQIKNNTHESGHDEVDKSNVTTTTTTTTAVPTMSNPNQTCEMDTTKSMDSENISEARNSTGDGILEKLTDDINKQSNLIDTSVASAQQQNDIANNTLNNSAAKLNSDEAAKASMSASSSESPSNTSPTPKKRTVTKKKINNRCNGKMGGGSGSGSSSGKSNANKSNQKNAKSNDKSEKKSDSKKTKSKDDSTAADGLNKFRGPYVHVDRDGTVDVINAPLNEEIAEKQSKFKKSYISQRPADRNRVRGLHISTLSNKYDAVTIDISWMCVFCKLGPHKFGLGDLFGPFILSTESEDFQLAQIDPKQDVFKSHRSVPINAALLHNISAIAAKSMSKPGNASNVVVKKKRKLNQLDAGTTSNLCANAGSGNSEQSGEIDIFYGMTQAIDSSYEVWAHEDCIVWASGVHIIGARVVGLETAVWGSVRHQCSFCKQYGAMLSCLKRSCTNEVHLPCAKRCDWSLDEHTFQSRCSEHKLEVNDNDHQFDEKESTAN